MHYSTITTAPGTPQSPHASHPTSRPTTMEGCVLRPPNSQLFSDDVIGGVMQRSRTSQGVFAAVGTDTSMDARYRTSQHLREQQWSPRTRKHGEVITPSRNAPTGRWKTHQEDTRSSPGSVPSPSRSGELQQSKGLSRSYSSSRVASGDSAPRNSTREAKPTHEAMAELVLAEKLRLRELRRVRQIRYRKKKENYMHSLEEETAQLRDEIEQLEQRRRSVLAAIPAKESAWSVAVEYFRLFRFGVASCQSSSSSSETESSVQLDFLRASMAQDVLFNTDSGVDAMMKTWNCISSWFAHIETELERLDKDACGFLVATTTTSVTISEHTLRHAFPRLYSSDGGVLSELASKLLGQTLVMRGWVRIEWDGAYCRVASVISQSDMVTPMLRLLGSLEDVSRVFDGASITPDFQVKALL
ncbi:unnamed protein product [Phytophthora lilii]|uniref:Unnamed protein product n=1 Tax=Phytophthora lilii TaxID=2077276 RepID=A0A9W6U9D3_9STRA|nr:unnamed protein product [Phytophthora lilii]